ncbi:MAG: hypothetical protein L0Z53_04785, partial [Acidobacteriales bacterium]|nr:hypothetical protein [Terriglobales bacterium]
MLSHNMLYYGRDDPLPESISLRAGPLTLLYENGDLRYIRLGEHEIVRRIYVAVRDRNWGTVSPGLSNVQMDIQSALFHISYEAEHTQDELDFFWRGVITGEQDGTIVFSMEGEARSTFLRNRIGFCVLHPIRECAGTACNIEHVDGSTEDSAFPVYIGPQHIVDGISKPHHPFEEMRAMTYPVMAGLWAEIRFAGDIFEMEDQRN